MNDDTNNADTTETPISDDVSQKYDSAKEAVKTGFEDAKKLPQS